MHWHSMSLMPARGNTRRGRRVPRPFDASREDAPRLATNLAADRVLLLVERALVGTGDMAAVERRHGALFAAYLAVLPVERPRLASGDLALAVFLVDTAALVCQPIVDLIASGMVPFPRRFSISATDHSHEGADEHDGGQSDGLHRNHVVLLACAIRAIGKPRLPLILTYGASQRLVPTMTGECNLHTSCNRPQRSSQTSSMRQPLKMLFTTIVIFFTSGRQQVPPRM